MNDRDGSRTNSSVVSFGPFHLYAAERLLKKGDEPHPLGSRTFDILIALIDSAGEIVSHRELIARAWADVTVGEANRRIHVDSFRNAVGDGREGSRYILNVRGRGYSFVAPVTRPITERSSPSREVAAF